MTGRSWTFPEREGLSGAKAIAFDLEHVFVRPARAQHDAIMTAHRAEPADVMLAGSRLRGRRLLLGHPAGTRPPVVVCGVVPLTIDSRDTAPFGMGLTPLRGPLGRLRNALWARSPPAPCSPRAERLAGDVTVELHGAATALPGPGLATSRGRDRAVHRPRVRVPALRRPREPALRRARSRPPAPEAPLPPWWGDLDGSRPVVHVTQGTIANRDYRQIIAPTLEALAEDDVLVVVSTGGRPLDTLPPLPANARAASYLPYDELLPETAVYVTNGGYGGVQYALRYGVPIVTSGGKEDKPEVAARIAWSGVGRRLNSETPSAAAVGTRCAPCSRTRATGSAPAHRREHGRRRRHGPARDLDRRRRRRGRGGQRPLTSRRTSRSVRAVASAAAAAS